MLVSWLRFYYHRIYTQAEEKQPPEAMLNYDLLVDDWLEAQDAQQKAESRKQTSKNRQKESTEFKMY